MPAAFIVNDDAKSPTSRYAFGSDTLSPQEEAWFDAQRRGEEATATLSSRSDIEPEPAPAAEPSGAEIETARMGAEAAERRVAEVRERHAADIARLQEREAILTHALRQQYAPPAQEMPPPDLNSDPIGAVAHLQRRVNQFEALEQQRQQTSAQQNQLLQTASFGQRQEEEFRQKRPDYGQAADFLRASASAELRAIGITDPAQIELKIGHDTVALIHASQQRGQNFAEAIYRMAEARGYRPGASTAPTAPAAPQVNAPAATGTTTRHAPAATPEQVAEMSEAQFAKWMEKASPSALRAALGE
jgi:hypothetical protein